jgi:hypothetical protein
MNTPRVDPQTRAAARPAATPAGMKVRAIQVGYYDNKLQRIGDVFTISSESLFSKKWMERVDADTPERTTTPQQVLDRLHDERPLGRVSRPVEDDDEAGGVIGVDFEPFA